MPELPPESAVHLKEWTFAHPGEARNAGYRRIGDEYVRIDLAERVIKKAHEARGQGNLFGMDMAFATSLGISEAGLKALMRDAGFRPAEAPAGKSEEQPDSNGSKADGDVVEMADPETPPTSELPGPAKVPDPAKATDAAGDTTSVSAENAGDVIHAAIPSVILTHWRWIGLPKPRPQEQRPERSRPQPKKRPNGGNANMKSERAAPAPKSASQPSALALQLAALKGLKL